MYTNGEFTGTHQQVSDFLGASIPRGGARNWPGGPWSEVAIGGTRTIEQRREARRLHLKSERTVRVSAPINNVQVASPEDREIVTWAAENLDSVHWIMADNTVQVLSGDELKAVIQEYAARKMQAFAVYADLVAQLAESDDPESIVWP